MLALMGIDLQEKRITRSTIPSCSIEMLHLREESGVIVGEF